MKPQITLITQIIKYGVPPNYPMYMKPIDKFGNKIYPKTFAKMQGYGRILINHGYLESKKKPNLFYKIIPQGQLYANMQGRLEVPIWGDTSPLFHWRLKSTIPKWERRRIIKKELINLFKTGCPCRLSFHFHQTDEFEGTCTQINEEEGVFEWDDGYCIICGKDFKDDGSYCSKECETKGKRKYALQSLYRSPRCERCNKFIISNYEWEDISKYCRDKLDIIVKRPEIGHHINYKKDITVPVCCFCHPKIRKGKVRNNLIPTDKRPKGNKLAQKVCPDCNHKFRPRHRNQQRCPACLKQERARRPKKSHKRYKDWVIETYG